MSGQLYTADFFRTELAQSYAAARHIVPLALDLVPARSVLDVGCGTGHFLRAFLEAGVADLVGIDGDYVPLDQLAVARALFRPVDLARPFALARRFDLVVSLEVAEHLPPASADGFVASLVRHGSAVLFSAAIPRQGGTGHINEQWPSYWEERFAAHGYRAYDALRPALWHQRDIPWWYRQNILLFADEAARERYSKLAAVPTDRPAMLDRVHPEFFLPLIDALQAQARELQALKAFLSGASTVDIEPLPGGTFNLTRR